MATKRRSFWMLVVSLVACSLGILLESESHHCTGAPWVCTQQGIMHDFWMILIPMLFLLLRGCFAGVQQLWRTRQLLRVMLALPHHPLPAQIVDMVRRLNIEGRVRVVEYETPEAFCYGLVRPRICLTAPLLTLLSPAELEAVLRHERHHLRRYDPLRTVVWTILSNTFWWLEDHAQHAHLLRELAADRAVIAEQGRSPLASALLKLLAVPDAQQIGRPDIAVSGLSVTDARIEQLIDPERVTAPTLAIWQWLYVPGVLLLTMIFCSVVMAHTWA